MCPGFVDPSDCTNQVDAFAISGNGGFSNAVLAFPAVGKDAIAIWFTVLFFVSDDEDVIAACRTSLDGGAVLVATEGGCPGECPDLIDGVAGVIGSGKHRDALYIACVLDEFAFCTERGVWFRFVGTDERRVCGGSGRRWRRWVDGCRGIVRSRIILVFFSIPKRGW